MAPETVPDDLRRFILASIPSVPSMEALLLLKGDARREWPVPEIARRLYLPEKAALETLRALCEAGIAAPAGEGRYRFEPATDELRAMVDRLVDRYAHDLIGVTTVIHSRVGKSAQVFADAFKLRKDD